MNWIICLFLVLTSALPSEAQSGNAQVDHMIRSMINDLEMDRETRGKFIDIYKAYGRTMKEAKAKTKGATLYVIYVRASNIRDEALKEILTSEQFRLFKIRQETIDEKSR